MRSAPFVLEYTYKRSTGPVIGRFLTGLLDRRVEGVRTDSGRVLVPPREYDPDTGRATDGWVTVANEGAVVAHSPGWALVRLDGADTALLHRMDGQVETGDRVRIRWADERVGHINDIACFERTE